ncbi:MAG: energy transducer TonB [Magnetospirillum gryphiswaldense]|nr:energy transducer TonB [Magnetospirillum gryphiswaldense]
MATATAGHGLVLAALMVGQTLVPPPKPVEAAILIDLPPAPDVPKPQPAPPKKVQAPKPKAVTPPPVKAVTPPTPQPTAPPQPQQSASAPAETAPAPSEESPAAPVRPVADPQAVSSWQSRLLAHLERHKTYPAQAQRQRLRGQVVVCFTMDRSGMILTQSVRDQSGHALLDRAALDMLARAQPLPAPPPQVEGALVTVTVPVKFTLN